MLETQISSDQNKGKALVQKVVQPLADQIPPNIASYITAKQFFNTSLIAKGSTLWLYNTYRP